MSSLIGESTEDSIKDWPVIAALTTGIFFVLKAANVKQPKASLDAAGVCEGKLVTYCTVYKKFIND